MVLSGPLSTSCLKIAAFTALAGVFKHNRGGPSTHTGCSLPKAAELHFSPAGGLALGYMQVLAEYMQSVLKYHSIFLCMQLSIFSVSLLIRGLVQCRGQRCE